MSVTYCKKIKVDFTKEVIQILDGQSKICNWLYNHLLSVCKEDIEQNNNSLRLLENRNLRDYGVSLKEQYPFLKTVFSSALKEPSSRLLRAFKSYYNGNTSFPKYRSWKKKWFSLVFDEPNKGWEIINNGKTISISLGNIYDINKLPGKKNPSVQGKLKEKLALNNNEIIKTFSLCKQQGDRFFAIFTVERCSTEELQYKKSMTTYRKNYYKAKKKNIELPVKPVLPSKRRNRNSEKY